MLTTLKPLSKPSQLPLVDGNNQSIIPESKAKCPSCGKRGHVKVLPHSGIRTVEGYRRGRICLGGCNYVWYTLMKLPLHCMHCNSYNNYSVINTVNERDGINRIHRCNCCGKVTPSFERFLLPDDKKPQISKLSPSNFV